MNSDFNFNRVMKAKEQIELVNGDELLAELVETVKKYIVADEEIIIVVVLWCIMTWCMNIVYYAPILHITSSEKQSGKTRLLNIIKRLSYDPEIISSITKAALSRKISDYHSTMLFDKLEKSFLRQKNVVDIFVSGFIKGSGSIAYCTGVENKPKSYNTWGAKAICSLGTLPKEIDAISIVLPLKRKLANETIKDVIYSAPEVWKGLRNKIDKFVEKNKEIIATIEVSPVEELTDKANDCWNSLFRIAQAAGGDWFERVKKAAISLTGKNAKESNNIKLLKAISIVFEEKQVDNIGSVELCTILNEQYSDLKILNKGIEVTPIRLANSLKEYGLRPDTVTLNGGKKLKGYKLKQFTNIFNKYLQDD